MDAEELIQEVWSYGRDNGNIPDDIRNALGKSLSTMAAEVKANNVEKGWYDEERSVGDEVALLHSEVSEFLDAWRKHGFTEQVVYENVRHASEVTFGGDGPNDLSNLGREQLEEMFGIGKPIDAPSEAADVLIRLLDLCERHGIDLEAEYERKMRFNRTRSYRHGGRAL